MINFIDAADVYSRGASETLVGNALKGTLKSRTFERNRGAASRVAPVMQKRIEPLSRGQTKPKTGLDENGYDNIRAMDMELTDEDIAELNRISDPGVPYPQWMVLQLNDAEDPRPKVHSSRAGFKPEKPGRICEAGQNSYFQPRKCGDQ